MGNNTSKRNEYYAAIQRGSQTVDNIDPYDVFGLNKNFEWDELKDAYRRVAKLVHPDKGGSEVLFNRVTECFKTLALEYKARQADRPHHNLRTESQDYMRSQSTYDIRGTPSVGSEANFLDRFNRTFEENKLEDDQQGGGYGHIMAQSSKTREDLNVPSVLKGKVSAEQFNKTFETVTLASASKDVVVYKEPEALPLARKLQYTELGGERPDDYSSTQEGTRGARGLQYTDYMKAYTTTRLVDPRAIPKKKAFKSVEEYQNVRDSAMERPATEEELQFRAIRAEQERAREAARERRLADNDMKVARHHAKVNQMLLGTR